MPLTSAISAHSPLRMCSSAWLRPNALTSITAWPAFGSGSGISRISSTSGPPNCFLRIARMRVPPTAVIGHKPLPSPHDCSAGDPPDPGPLLAAGLAAEEVPHESGDLVPVRLQGKVAGVEQVELQGLQVPLVRLGPGRWEDGVVLAPRHERRRLVGAEVLLPR